MWWNGCLHNDLPGNENQVLATQTIRIRLYYLGSYDGFENGRIPTRTCMGPSCPGKFS